LTAGALVFIAAWYNFNVYGMADFLSTFVPVSFAALAQKALTTTTAIAVFFGGQPLVYEAHRQTASTAAAIAPAASSFISAPFDHAATTTTIINQYITRPVIERTVERNASASNDDVLVELRDFDSRLAALAAAFNVHQEASAPLTGGGGLPYANTFGLSQRIDTLANTTISNPIITGGSITGAAIAGTLTNAISSAIATIADLTTVELVATNATTTSLYVAGTVNFASPLSIASGGIGTSTAPAYGQLLLGNALGGYDLVATSSLGIASATAWGSITGTLSDQTDLQSALSAKLSLSSWFSTTTDALTEGASNKYYSDTMVNAYLHASTTLAKTYAANTWSALQQFDNASSTNFSSFGTAYFGGTATSTFDSAGNLAIVSNGLSVGASQLVVSSGNVGIGTTTPGSTLDVNGFGRFVSPNNGTTGGVVIRDNASNSGNYLQFVNNAVSNQYGYIQGLSSGGLALMGGNVGIGTTTPTTALEVSHNNPNGIKTIGSSSNSIGIALINTITSGRNWSIASSGGGPAPVGSLAIYDNTANAERVTINTSGNVGIGITGPTYQLQLSIDSAGKPNGGSWSNSSDERLKTNIVGIDDGLERLLKLQPVSFDWRNPDLHGGATSSAGFIAQNIKSEFPRWVTETPCTGADCNLVGGATTSTAYSLSLPFEFDAMVVSALKNIASVSGTFKSALVAWFSNSTNEIDSLFARTFHAHDEVCIGSTCLNEAQLRLLLAGVPAFSPTEASISTSSVSATSTPEAAMITIPTGTIGDLNASTTIESSEPSDMPSPATMVQ
jgi:hypothetical protein